MDAVSSSSLCKFPWPCATFSQAKCYCYHYKPNLRHWNVALDSFGKEHRIMKRETTVKTYSSRVEMAVNERNDKFEQVQKQKRSDLSVVVLDIEGTTTPIAFVTESLYPYARNNVISYLLSTFESEETQADINLLRKQAEEDFKAGIYGAKLVPPSDSNKEDIVEAVAANVFAMIEADRKVTALKELQGHIWRYGFAKGELQGDVFEDVPRAFSQWHADGSKVYIYSSGSREAQRLIFGNTQYGDLRRFLSGYFDTVTAGNKRVPRSYKEICLSVGVDEPSQVVFATDVIQEAIAAKEAGLRAVIVVRPGNAPLPQQHDFTTITTLLEL